MRSERVQERCPALGFPLLARRCVFFHVTESRAGLSLKLQSELCFYIFYFSSDFPFQIFIPSSIISSLFSFHFYFLQYFFVFLFLFLFPSIIPDLQIKIWRNILLFFSVEQILDYVPNTNIHVWKVVFLKCIIKRFLTAPQPHYIPPCKIFDFRSLKPNFVKNILERCTKRHSEDFVKLISSPAL